MRTIAYVGKRRGPAMADAGMLDRRRAMNLAGAAVPVGVEIIPHPNGPGKSEWVRPRGAARPEVVLFLHGSGYSKGSPASHRPLVSRLVRETGCAAYVADYRLTPEHPFPAALEDALDAYRFLLADHPAADIAILGDSAGGGLALATVLAARDEKLARPAAVVTLSAWADLAVTGAARPDVDDPRVTQEMLRAAAALYLDGADPFDPYASPLYGDFAGFPPLLMQVGGREILIEDTRRVAEKVRASGGRVVQSVYPCMAHVFQLNQPETESSAQAIAEIASFLNEAFSGP